MKGNVIVTPDFKRDVKKLLKKYPSLKSDLARLAADLSLNPKTGTQLSAHVYKIRLAIKSKGKGKSGGARVSSYVDNSDNTSFFSVNTIANYDSSIIPYLDSSIGREHERREGTKEFKEI